jgi:hypothetical protein
MPFQPDCFDADPDCCNSNPNPTFHFDTDPDQDPDPTPSLTHVGKAYFFSFSSKAMPVCIVFLSRQYHRSHNFLYFGLWTVQ